MAAIAAGLIVLAGLAAALVLVLTPGSARKRGAVAASAPAAIAPRAASAYQAAVASALRHGQLNVVLDTPAGGALTEQEALIAQGAAVGAAELDSSRGRVAGLHIEVMPESLEGLSSAAVAARLQHAAGAALVLPCEPRAEASLAAAAAGSGALLLSPCAFDAGTEGRDPRYWGIGASPAEEAGEIASFLSTEGYRRAFVVDSGASYAALHASALRAAAAHAHLRIVGSVSVPLDSRGYAEAVAAVKAVAPRPSVVLDTLPTPYADGLAAALVDGGATEAVIGTSAMDTRAAISSGASEHLIVASYGFAREGKAAARFISDYRKRYGKAPVGSFPALGLETLRVLAAAVAKAHSGQPAKLQAALASGLTVEGVGLADRVYRSGEHEAVSEVGIEKVAGPGFEPLLAGSPTSTPAP